jgi:trehalose-phosphatase
LLESLAELEPRLSRAAHLAVFLDYDGTLAEIAARPADARLRPGVRLALSLLSRRKGVRVAIVSGRSLSDVRTLVGLRGLIYAGCHGLEMRGPRVTFSIPDAFRKRTATRRAAKELEARLRHVAGVEVEDKGLTVAVHFRRAGRAGRAAAARAVRAVARDGDGLFRSSHGKKVWELLPNVDWDKGRAVRWILARSGVRRALPVYIGDDATDEHAFAALPRGITVKAGRSARTCAAYSVSGPAAVETFLSWLNRIRT